MRNKNSEQPRNEAQNPNQEMKDTSRDRFGKRFLLMMSVLGVAGYLAFRDTGREKPQSPKNTPDLIKGGNKEGITPEEIEKTILEIANAGRESLERNILRRRNEMVKKDANEPILDVKERKVLLDLLGGEKVYEDGTVVKAIECTEGGCVRILVENKYGEYSQEIPIEDYEIFRNLLDFAIDAYGGLARVDLTKEEDGWGEEEEITSLSISKWSDEYAKAYYEMPAEDRLQMNEDSKGGGGLSIYRDISSDGQAGNITSIVVFPPHSLFDEADMYSFNGDKQHKSIQVLRFYQEYDLSKDGAYEKYKAYLEEKGFEIGSKETGAEKAFEQFKASRDEAYERLGEKLKSLNDLSK